jgi:hypothetical protein
MAELIPDDIGAFKTEGEGRFYHFLKNVAKPDIRFFGWYLPDIQGREPDFILFSADAGLIVFEVKDWDVQQIIEADPNWFVLDMGGRLEKRKNPLKQAKEYFEGMRDRITQDKRLVSTDPNHFGRPKIPLSYAVVFSNIDKYAYTDKNLEQVIGMERAFFWDDLHPDGDICSDTSGRCFREALLRMFPVSFPFQLPHEDFNHLRQVIFPTVRVQLPERKSSLDHEQHKTLLRMLDRHQETIARKYDAGHRIIVGPSGCGKTLVLVHKAAFFRQYNPAVKSILFVCYNITLVNYIKRLLSEKGIPLGPGGVDVVHFYELCSRIVGEPVHYENEDGAYYDTVLDLALEKLAAIETRYDAILVDEGQDFTDGMYRLVTGLLNPKTDNLTIALDENQNIYRNRQSWKDVGVKARGRVHPMSLVYRNTQEISRFASRLIGLEPCGENTVDNKPALFPPAVFEAHGPKPELKPFKTSQELVSYVADAIRNVIQGKEYSPSEIAVIYTVKHAAYGKDPSFSLPYALKDALDSRGVLSSWVSEDYRAKNSYDITTDRVAISTIHSAKGLDWACVFVLGLDTFDNERWAEEQWKRLAYVGLTRARHRLLIPYVRSNQLIAELKGCL